ncbi:type 4b pilus protein PilO2 [Thalassospira xiamenensis]|uniref:Pilin accessory protein (PilO) n=1 Tax=Thalassospira xiamenensis TaxID=220697 RepID=A0A285TXM9_9PROT|nr:type 4b pilus protein PilO2 [Thalassospira xiamenensis]SOC27057.1 Pilin accessory protein (PilO) [Thalassospira xiamenensis]
MSIGDDTKDIHLSGGVGFDGFVDDGLGTIGIGGKAFAIGLQWRGFEDPTKGKPVEQARRAATGARADLFCLRHGVQFGLGSKGMDHRPGMASLAAFLADTIDGNWIGVFKVNEGGLYYVAAKDGAVLPGCDRFFNDEEAALAAFSDLAFVYEWNHIFAPEEWHEDAQEAKLEEILRARKPATKLRSVSSTGKITKYGIAGLVVLGLGLGYQQYQDYLAEQAAVQAAILAAQSLTGRKPPPPPPPMPWEGVAQGIPALFACVDGILDAEIVIPGWKTETVSCHNEEVSLSLVRDGGTVNWIADTLNRDGFRPSINPNGDSAVVSWKLEKAPEYPKNLETDSLRKIRRYLYSHFEELFHGIALSNGTRTEYYDTLNFAFSTSYYPTEFAGVLAEIPVFELSKVELDIMDMSWKIEGKIYEQLPLPQKING